MAFFPREWPTQPPSSNGQLYAPIICIHNNESSEAAVRDLGSGHFDGNSFPRSMIEVNYNSVDNVNVPPAQLTLRYQDTVSDTLLKNYQDPGLTAGVDDWAFSTDVRVNSTERMWCEDVV